MPICKREGFEDFTKNPKQYTFHDNEEVFYCETTKQIFRVYEEYFRHVMVINSTIWQCEATKRENLTYAEALKSERRARKKMEQFKDCLRPIVLLLVEKAQQASMKTLCRIAYDFIRARFFINEDVEAVNNSSVFYKYLVVSIIPKTTPESGVYDPKKVTYKLRRIGGNFNGKEYLIPYENIRRSRVAFCHDNLQMFIKDNVIRVDGILHPKPESYKKYVTERKVSFGKSFVGKMPYYEPSKPSKPKKTGEDGDKKQSTMSKYLTKTNQVTAEQEAARMERAKSLREEMERLRKQKEEKQAELERKKAERVAKIDEQAKALVKKSDDLERYDQKPLPKYQKITTHGLVEYFGDCITVLEFMHSFESILTGLPSAFKNNLSLYELSRACTVREVAGPLSDIILILLGTIFELQQEEERECTVEYAPVRIKEREPYITMAKATKTQEHVRRFLSAKINELPLDARTLSEVLRLHLLASGSQVGEKAERWRVMYRNGYYSNEDPGLQLRMSHPHLLKFLSVYTVYQLPMPFIFQIIHTLMAQILTYSSPLNTIEARMEQAIFSKMDLRALLVDENRRVAHMEYKRKKLVAEYDEMIKKQPDQAIQLREKLVKKVNHLQAQSAREKKKYDNTVENLQKDLFYQMTFLGMDRAYRKYYILESIPGVFVEHSPECHDTCLKDPPKNVPQFVGCPRTLKELRMHLSRIYTEEEDPSRKKRKPQTTLTTTTTVTATQDNKENKENQVVVNGEVKLNGDVSKLETNGEVVETIVPDEPAPPPSSPTQYQLMMCTGDPANCIVHDPNNPDRQLWAFFHTEEDLDELINSLNPLGERESMLLEHLRTMRTLIVDHIKRCPVEILSSGENGSLNFSRFRSTWREKTRKRYNASNYGFPENCDLNSVMYAMLLDRILQIEVDITTGDLGRLKITDIDKWRLDLQNDTFNPQCDEVICGETPDTRSYKDPGHCLDDEIQESHEEIKCVDNPEADLWPRRIKNLATALLQIEQGIEQRFLKEPFGVKKETKDKEKMEQLLDKGRERLRRWELSLMHSTSFSQIFLHFSILHSAIKWQRSTNKSSCQICRLMNDPEKMLLCDECNDGTHMYCMKPKMKTVPEGNWYCKRCVSTLGLKNASAEVKKKPRKRAFLLDEEDVTSEGGSSFRSNGHRRSKHMRMEEIEHELRNGVQDGEEEQVGDEEEEENDDVDEENVVEEEVEEEEEEEDEVEEEEEEEEGGDDEEEAVDDEEEINNDDEEDEDEIEEAGNEAINRRAASATPVTDDIDNDNEENDDISDDDDEICVICSYNGGEIACTTCKSVYHLDCAELKRTPRSNWTCSSCKGIQSRKRKSVQNDDSTEDEDYDLPLVKRIRPSATNKRSSARSSINDNSSFGADEIIRTNNNNARRSRRANESLPLNSLILYDLLHDIMKHDSSWPFLRPVSHCEVPDYHTIIKEPMDFAKVKSKLNMGKYTINEELLKDIELIFKNCDIYNQEGNEIYIAGSTLEKFVMERCKELNLPFSPSDMNR